MEIISVNNDNLEEVYNFLKSLSIIKDINEDVVMNGEYVYDGDIIGFLSFEVFNRVGLVRYFVFKKLVDQSIVKELFMRVCRKAKSKNIEIMITLVVKEEAINVFKELGFVSANKEDVYIDEVNISDTRFKDAIILKYDL